MRSLTGHFPFEVRATLCPLVEHEKSHNYEQQRNGKEQLEILISNWFGCFINNSPPETLT